LQLRRLVPARLALCLVLLAFTFTIAAAGTITVDPAVNFTNGLYHYNYAISNTTPDDVFLIDVPVPRGLATVMNLTAPVGFLTAYDSGLGLVSFLENTARFTSTPLSGFAFDSPNAPGAASFQATVLNSSTGGVYTQSGPTTAPVPEPGYSAVLALLLPGLALVGARRQKENL
jgi:hypothetical protein